MSPINGIQGAPNPNPAEVGQVQGQPQAVRANNAGQPQRINDIVRQAEVLPHQQRRAERTTAQQVGYVLARVAGAVLSLGTSELVISWMRVAERQNVEALRQQALERRTSATQFNNELGEALSSGKKVADHIQPGVSEAMNELRTNFGDLVPENATSIADLPSKFSLGSAVKDAVTALQGEATAADVKSIITGKATPVLQKKAVENALGQSLKKCGLDSNPALLIDVFLRQIPELLRAVQGCQNRADLDGVIANHAASIDRYAELLSIKQELHTNVLAAAKGRLAQELKVSPEQLDSLMDIKKLNDAIGNAKESFTLAHAPLRGDGTIDREAMEARFKEAADAFVEKKLSLIRSADGLDISADLRIEWQSTALSDRNYSSPELFRKAVEAAKAMDITQLAALFTQGGTLPTEEMVRARFESTAFLLEEKLVQLYGAKGWDKLDGDGQGTARYCALQAILDRVPSLKEGLGLHPEILSAVEENARALSTAAFEGMQGLGDEASLVARTVANDVTSFVVAARSANEPIKAEALPLAYLQAMEAREFMAPLNYPDAKLPANVMEARLPSGQTMPEALNAALRGPVKPTPEQLADVADTFLHRSAAESRTLEIIRGKAEAAGMPLSDEASLAVLTSLLEAYPDLGGQLAATQNEVMLLQVLVEVEGRMDALILEGQKPELIKAALDSAVSTLGQNLGLSTEEVRTRMEGAVADMEKSLASFAPENATKDVPALYAAEAQRFVEKATAAFYAIGELGLSPQRAAMWQERMFGEGALSPEVVAQAQALAKASAGFNLSQLAMIMEHASWEFPAAFNAFAQYLERNASMTVGLSAGHTKAWAETDLRTQADILTLALDILVDRADGLRQKFDAAAEPLKDVLTEASKTMDANSGSGEVQSKAYKDALVSTMLANSLSGTVLSNDQLSEAVGSSKPLPTPYLMAMRQAEAEVRNAFPGVELPENMLKARYVDGEYAGRTLADMVKKAPGSLSPADFAALVTQAFSRVASEDVARSLVAKSVESVDVADTKAFEAKDNVRFTLDALFERHPDLARNIAAARNPQEVQTLLGGHADTITALGRVFSDNSKAWVAGEQYLFRRMAEATGLPEAELKEKLNTTPLLRGNTFHYKRMDYYNAIKDPNLPLESYPTLEEQIRDYEGIAERFVSRKGALWQSVDGLPGLSAALRNELKQSVLSDVALKKPDFFERCSRVSGGMYEIPFKRAIDGGSDAEVLKALRKLGTQYEQFSRAVFDPILSDMGPEEKGAIQVYSLKMFMDRSGLHNAIDAKRYESLKALVERDIMDQLGKLNAVSPDKVVIQDGRQVSVPNPAYIEAIKNYTIALTMQAFLEHMRKEEE